MRVLRLVRKQHAARHDLVGAGDEEEHVVVGLAGAVQAETGGDGLEGGRSADAVGDVHQEAERGQSGLSRDAVRGVERLKERGVDRREGGHGAERQVLLEHAGEYP